MYPLNLLRKCISKVYCRSVLRKCILQMFCASVVCFCISSLSYLCPDGKWASAPSSTSDGIIRHVRKIRLCCRAHGYYQMTSQLCLKCWTAKMEHKICLAAQEQCASCAHIATGLLLSVRGPIHNRQQIANMLLTHYSPQKGLASHLFCLVVWLGTIEV